MMDNDDRKYKLFEIMRKERFKSLDSAVFSHDKLLAALSSALIAFSITIARIQGPEVCNALLYVSWVFVFISLLVFVIIFWLSYKYNVDMMRHDEDVYLKEKKSYSSPCSANLLLVFRVVLDVSFLLSLLLFLMWAGMNVV